jgi:molybdopterin-guanine dinucleotide biosynthesis protein A
MAPASRSQITGLVLAGGRGTRMGGADKGWVLHEGEALVRRVVRRFAPQVGTLLVSANRTLDAYRSLGEVVTDSEADPGLEPFPGPLAGVLAGLARATTPLVALAPCDAPALPDDLVARLLDAIGERDVACPVAGGRRQPTFALLRRDARASLEAYLRGGGRAMQGWFDTLAVAEVAFADATAFTNVNAPGDVTRAT